MGELIEVFFQTHFRKEVAKSIKTLGIKRVEQNLLQGNFHPSYVKVIIKSIMSKEGW